MRITEEKKYEVSVIVLSYHPDWTKERQTLLSVLCQKGISLEIIVADDGSEENHRERIRTLFADYDFTDYRLVMNPENRGTIANYISGLKVANGEFTKAISPGDYLTGATVLRDWLAMIRESGCEWSFSEAVFYRREGEEEKPVNMASFPIWIRPYQDHRTERARWNYVVLDDVAHGSTLIGKTELQLRYAKMLFEVGNRYAEDHIYRLMMFDGNCGEYYPEGTVFYETGTGISTGKNRKWLNILREEAMRTQQLMLARKHPDQLQKRMQRYLKWKNSMLLMALIPGKMLRFLLVQARARQFPFDFQATEKWRKQCR